MALVLSAPATPRFANDFTLAAVPPQGATAAEQAYVDAVMVRALPRLAVEEAADLRAPQSAVTTARRDARAKLVTALRREAEEVVNGTLEPATAADNVFVHRGLYLAMLNRLDRSLFVVREKLEEGGATDVQIRVATALPPPDDKVPPDKQDLYVALDGAVNVIKTVYMGGEDDRHGWRSRLVGGVVAADRDVVRRRGLLDSYMRKLAGIGRLGLEAQHTQLAGLALTSLKAEFVLQEAGRIKNAYARRLGISAVLVAVLALELCWLGKTFPAFDFFLPGFTLAAAGAALGTWLSFSIRRVTLAFEDLAALEEDRLDPALRILFVVALTMTVCLLFHTKAVNLEIGMLKTAELDGATALLVGVLSGIAERALATAVSGRATTFARAIGN